MRADRMVAILLMLQQRGRVTAPEVAAELEVSERTARRDLDALGQAGLPVYSQRGRNGGWWLVGGGRTDLSGLTAAEARALFLVAGPSSGTTPELRAALRKLAGALPEPFRESARAASGAVLVDGAGWDRTHPPETVPPHLAELQRLVAESRQARLGYRARDGASTQRLVHPLGLVHKGRTWYVLADTDQGRRTFRVDRVTSVEATDDPAERPEDFDLEAAWRDVVARMDERRTPLSAHAVVDPGALGLLRMVLGDRVQEAGHQEDGRLRVVIRGHGVRPLAAEIAGFGAAVEVLDPEDVRVRLAEIGRELGELYRPGEDRPAPLR